MVMAQGLLLQTANLLDAKAWTPFGRQTAKMDNGHGTRPSITITPTLDTKAWTPFGC